MWEWAWWRAVSATSIGPIYHVYDVGIELSNAGLAPSEEIVGAALDDAARAIALGTGLAAVRRRAARCRGRRLRPSTRTVRTRFGWRERRADRGRVVVGGAIALINAGSIYDSASDRWETFKSDKETPNITGPRFSASYSEQRYDYWRVAVEAFRDRPVLGLGAGNYGRHYDAERRFSKASRYTHDIWLRTLSEGGLVGILLLLGFLAVAFGGLLSVRRRGRGDAAVLAVAAVAVSTYFFIHASFDWLEEFPALAVPAFAFPLVALVAAAAAPGYVPSRGMGRGRRAGLVVAASLAGIAVAALAIQYLALRYFERAGRLGASDRGRCFRGPRPSGGPQPSLGPAASPGRRPCGQGRRPGTGSRGLWQGARRGGRAGTPTWSWRCWIRRSVASAVPAGRSSSRRD